MSGQNKTKLKTLYLHDLLERETDAQHGVSVPEIVEALAAQDIPAERKSVYTDLDLLREYGMDLEKVHGRRTEYRLMSRTFELPELKLLVDAVGASKFITRKKSLSLIEKLETLCSRHEARELRRSVWVDKRVKTMNESIYYNVDTVHSAINDGKKLSFKYFTYAPNKQRVLKRSGKTYIVTPLALTYSEENYYLYAWSGDDAEVRIYRVDRMMEASEMAEDAEQNETTQAFDPAAYSNELFSMFSGQKKRVSLEFDNSLCAAVLDRFGADAILVPQGDSFTMTAEVIVSPTFLGWIFGLDGKARILGPAEVRAEFGAMLDRMQQMQR